MLCVVHTERDCIYDELVASYNIARYPKAIMNKQVNHYRDEGFLNIMALELWALYSDNIILRFPKLMDDWWNEIIKYTNQDQLSFAYVAWKNNFHPSVSPVYYGIMNFGVKQVGEKYHHKFESLTLI